ncbi:hypothetical protein ACSMDG_09250 [Yersinia proxima]
MKRIDNTAFLYHWVKAEPYARNQLEDYESAYQTFMEILSYTMIKNGDLYKTNGCPCICFTESPEYFMHSDKSKYQPFGFKFLKRSIFNLGGRAVIYSPDYEKNLIHDDLIWRYMRHDPLAYSEKTPYGVDFTWEREWRLPEPELSVKDGLGIIVPNEEFVERVYDDTDTWLNSNASYMHEYDGYAVPHPDYEYYIDTIREMLMIPEEFE